MTRAVVVRLGAGAEAVQEYQPHAPPPVDGWAAPWLVGVGEIEQALGPGAAVDALRVTLDGGPLALGWWCRAMLDGVPRAAALSVDGVVVLDGVLAEWTQRGGLIDVVIAA